jgi:hypothetical protein
MDRPAKAHSKGRHALPSKGERPSGLQVHGPRPGEGRPAFGCQGIPHLVELT